MSEQSNGATTTPPKVVSREDLLATVCPFCDAGYGRTCHQRGRVDKALRDNQGNELFHPARVLHAQQNTANRLLPRGLTTTDKSLIVYYAFIQLCDSCSTRSMDLFGKEYTSQEIQRFFAKTAITELRKDGLLE